MFVGDILVKSGDWEKGIVFYKGIKKVKDYDTWPFHKLLDERIKNAGANVANFRKVHPKDRIIREPVMISISEYSCAHPEFIASMLLAWNCLPK